MTEGQMVATAARLNRAAFLLMVGGYGVVTAAFFVVDVSALYFLGPLGPLPHDVGGFPTVCWLVLMPLALTAALVLQLPVVLALHLRGRLMPALRARVRRSGAAIAVVGATVLLLALQDGAVAAVVGSLLLVEGMSGMLVARARGQEGRDITLGRGGATGPGPARFRGQAIAFLLLFGFGCFPSARSTLPSPRSWWEARDAARSLASRQTVFAAEHGRLAKHLSELGWEGYTDDITMTESDSVLTIEVVHRVARRTGLTFGANEELRCVVTLEREGREWFQSEAGEACTPPRPRGGDASDIGSAPVAGAAGFATLFLGVPTVVAAVLAGLSLGLAHREGRARHT